MEIKIAQCCGACKYVNIPKKPEDHAAYYTVAKTERWCYKHGIPVTRETVCDEFEIENKKGAVPAFKRILAFNKKLEEIIRIKNWMEENNILSIKYSTYEFSIVKGKVYYRYTDWNSDWYLVSCKESNGYERLIKAYEEYRKEHNV
jgi:hypothetical protein